MRLTEDHAGDIVGEELAQGKETLCTSFVLARKP